MLDGEELAGAPKSALDLVGDEEDSVPSGELAQPAQKIGGRRDESALAQDRLDDHRGDPLRGDLRVEQALQRRKGSLRIPAAVLLGGLRPVDLPRVRAPVLPFKAERPAEAD